MNPSFSAEILFPPAEKPAWAPLVSRWHQLDGASFALVEAYTSWKQSLQTPSLIFLASEGASNEADADFVKTGAKSPSKMIHTLPSTRSSPLCQAMGWSGPVLCVQKDPHTFETALKEAQEMVGTEYPVVWVLGASPIHSEGTLKKYRVELVQLLEKPKTNFTFPVPVSLLSEALPHRAPMLWVDEVLWINDTQGECRVRLKPGKHFLDANGAVRISSLIEWTAQSYGFVKACQVLSRGGNANPYEQNYLAAFNDFSFQENAASVLQDSSEALVRIEILKELGPLTLIEGQVVAQGEVLASGRLKVYCA